MTENQTKICAQTLNQKKASLRQNCDANIATLLQTGSRRRTQVEPCSTPIPSQCWRLLWWCEFLIHWQQEWCTMGSPPSSAKVQNKWSYTSAPPICLHGVGTENFTFYSIHRKIVKSLKVFEIVCRKDNLDHNKRNKICSSTGNSKRHF
jgi:hypothetical protein